MRGIVQCNELLIACSIRMVATPQEGTDYAQQLLTAVRENEVLTQQLQNLLALRSELCTRLRWYRRRRIVKRHRKVRESRLDLSSHK